MFSYAWRVLTARPASWGPLLILGFLVAVPGSLAGTIFAAPATATLVAGSPRAALALMPGPLVGHGILPILVLGAGAAAILCLWSRIYSPAVWLSDDRNAASFGEALRATRRSWRAVALRYLEAGAAVGFLLLAVGVLSWAVGTTNIATVVLAGGTLIFAWRTLVRVLLTLAIRAVVLDGERGAAAWRRAADVTRGRRGGVIAAWVALLGAGVAVWMGGRLISPVLQDTAFDYPSTSGYAWAREGAQILLAAPLEGFLIGMSLGVWTAVHRGGELMQPPRVPTSSGGRRTDPWVVRALGALVVLAVVANGLPTAIDAAYRRAQTARMEAVGRREIRPEEALAPDDRPRASPSATGYSVDASLRDGRLEWTTEINYVNSTGERLRDVVVHVYPAAYARALERIPLASDLLASDFTGSFEATAEPGTIDLQTVRVDGRRSAAGLDDTILRIGLERPLVPGARVSITISLDARLPRWPERFGVWRDITLLGNWIPVVAVREHGRWRADPFGPVGDPFYSEIADYDVTFDVEDGVGIVGSGSLIDVQEAPGDRMTWRFQAHDLRDAAFAAGPFLRGLEASVGDTTVRSWFLADDRLAGGANLDTARRALDHYSTQYGKLPFDEVEIVETRGLFGGMEYPGVAFTSATTSALEGVPLLPDLLTSSGFEDAERRYVLGHEIAHQWWYAAAGNDQVHEPWLDEALAEASTRLWLRAEEGSDRTWTMTTLETESIPQPGAVLASITDFEGNRAYTDLVYDGGAAILLELRRKVGATTYDRIMRRWFEQNRNSIGTVDQFIATVRTVAGDEAAAFVEKN